jgi:hypothetical protein
MLKRHWVGLAALLLGSLGLVARAHAAKPRVAVLSVAAEQLSAEVRAKIDAAVAGGLAASGAEVVDSVATTRGIAARGLVGCDTSTCRVAIAEVTGTGYLVRGSVETMGRSYTVRLEMIDGATGSVIGMREDRCEICTESEAYETASVTASALKSEVLKRPSGDDGKASRELTKVPDRSARGGAGDAAGTATILSPGPPVDSRAHAASPRFRGVSWVGLVAGAVALGAGVTLLSIDGNGTCDHEPGVRCPRSYTTRTGGIALIGSGALVMTLGATLLIGRF